MKTLLYYIFFVVNISFSNNQFELYSNKESKMVSSEYVRQAYKKYEFLNTSIYYQRNCNLINTKTILLTDCNGNKFKSYYLDRSKNKTVVIVPPYGAIVDKSLHLAAFFDDYNIILVEYESSFVIKSFNQDFFNQKVSRVNAAIDWAVNNKTEIIIGFGQCYGSRLLLQADYEHKKNNKKSLNAVIIDSFPADIQTLIEKFSIDPFSIITFGKNKTPYYLQKLFYYTGISWLIQLIVNKYYPQDDIVQIFTHINCPILFLHGSKDTLLSTKQMLSFYNMAVKTDNKKLLITPYKHLYHTLKAKEVSCKVVHQFLKENVL